MIVWINGPFGGGKTTLATTLRNELPGAVVTDPEEIGFVLRQVFPGKYADFQDNPAWRPLVAQLVIHCHRENGGRPVLVPMTLLRRSYAAEIHDAVRTTGVPLRHLLLHARPDTVAARIDTDPEYPGDEARSAKVRAFRRGRLPRYTEAFADWLAADAEVIDTTGLAPRQVADRALELLATGGPEGGGR
ncbi:AAA family ATPase [Kitasatospora sp. NA04385]|uniref:AAA family ATPase n=1 Tax=Kitasatospora sp. NA04385 TaxID=2742135 RepID=UPI00158FA8C8|nr:AAA family ATPase [Kitasatospora sp. NA04385]QKW17842.1 AAA family ATPase [Kitasatospora sp. NA04385]